MYEHDTLKELARAKTRDAFRDMPTFLSLDVAEQKALFRDLYRRNYEELAAQSRGRANGRSIAKSNGHARALAGEKAGDLIDDSRHLNKRIDQAGELAGDFIDQVDFPGFVKDLLKGVFDANLAVTIQQIETYQKLLKTATESVSKFVNAIDDTAAFGYLAENQGDDFDLDFSDTEKNEDGSPKAILTNKDGEPVDLGDNQVKAKIMDAKIAMAKEQRALLRETILMGITRLVVEKGQVKASVVFDIKASEQINKADKAALKEAHSSGTSVSASGGLLGSIFGGPKAGYTSSHRKTKISVSSAKSKSSTDLSAKVAGSVDITFKSDYFKLDNFAQMYGPQAGAGAGGTAPAAPAPQPVALPGAPK
jgi:hypothetical protein